MSSFGYWVRRRRKALDLTQAALAHEVGCATITIKKVEHDERRPSRTMAERLMESLMIPEAQREAFISCGLGEISVDALPIISELTPPSPRADIHEMQIGTDASDGDRFVGRTRELVWLEQQLEAAKRGEGRIAFIAGEAGRGKTALMAEFAFQAVTTHSDLLVSSGTCNAFAGTGDPYLPFREVIGLLAGWGGMRAISVPESVFVMDSAPHSWVFPRMAAVVHHGGAGTTAEGLRAGVPSVILPFTVDQPFWGRRVKALGVGPEPIPQKKLSAGRLAHAIQVAVTQPEIKQRAARLDEAIRAEDGVGNAVRIVKQYLGA